MCLIAFRVGKGGGMLHREKREKSCPHSEDIVGEMVKKSKQ